MKGLDHKEEKSSEDVFLQDSLCPTIAEHAAQCNSLFCECMAEPEIISDLTIIDDQLARFKLWTLNMDVYGSLNVSLDYRLRFSPTVVEIIHQLLDLICDTLTSLKPMGDAQQTRGRKRQRISEHGDLEVTRRADDDASDSDGDMDQAKKNISKITDTIGGTVTRLFRLSNAVRGSAKANRAREIERYRDDEEANNAIYELRLYTESYIRSRFPKAPNSLRSALVEANELRLRRMYYQRSHRRRIDLSVQNPQTRPAFFELPKIKESVPAVRFASSMLPKPATIGKTSGPASPPPVPVTNATTAQQTAFEALYPISTTEVPRARSVLVNNKLSFPPIPPTRECPYCGVIIDYKSTSKSKLWHNHVIEDLEPFICIFAHCLEAGQQGTGPPTFETSRAWISHMQNAHGHTWECRAPSHDPILFDQEIQHLEHSIKKHGVPETYAGTLSSAARRPVINKVLECPFGDDFQSPEKVEPSFVFSSEALQSHVAAHMKEIALLALQKPPIDVDEYAESIDSDQTLEYDKPGSGKPRGSMYNMLKDDFLDFQNDAEATDGMSGHREEDISPSGRRLDLEDKEDLRMEKLRYAVRNGNLRLVESLIFGGTNLGDRDNGDRIALNYASAEQFEQKNRNVKGQAAKLRPEQEEQKRIEINARDKFGQTLLHLAADFGQTEIVKLLLEQEEIEINARDDSGRTSLHQAIIREQTEIIKLLLEQEKIEINARDDSGRTSLHLATSIRHTKIVKLLLEQEEIEINARDDSRRTSLHLAASIGHIKIVKLLLEQEGIEVNAQDKDGQTPLHQAVSSGHTEVVNLLEKVFHFTK